MESSQRLNQAARTGELMQTGNFNTVFGGHEDSAGFQNKVISALIAVAVFIFLAYRE
jgi:hypothetical protein